MTTTITNFVAKRKISNRTGSGSVVTRDLTKPPTVIVPPPGSSDRRSYVMEMPLKYTDGKRVQREMDDGPLVASKLKNGSHAPAIDIDVPAYLVPSSTEGHSHLYIDVEMPWWKYRLMLWAMKIAGVIEPGYYKASVASGASFLRRPGVKKEVET